MPDVTLSEALQEAYASAPQDDIQIHTLSFTYDGLLDEGGVPTEMYIFLGNKGDSTTTEGVPLKHFRLEPEAAINGGAVVEFIGIAFQIQFPDVTPGTPAPKGQLLIDGVGREVADLMQQAIDLGVSIAVTYRPYLESGALVGPEQSPVTTFSLTNVTITGLRVTADIIVPSKGNRRFPTELYDLTRFPTLVN